MAVSCEQAEVLLSLGHYAEALQAAGRAVTAEPGHPSGHILAARALGALGRPGEAADAAARAIQADPQLPGAHLLLAWALHGLRGDEAAVRSGVLGDALAAAREAVRLGPNSADAHACLGQVWADLDQSKEAEAEIRRALSLSPNRSDLWVRASDVALAAHRWRSAEQAALCALRLDPASGEALNRLGLALNGQGRWTMAAVAHFRFARIDPRSPAAHGNVVGIGFRYLASLAPLCLLPLLVIYPLFIVARIGLTQWILGRPERLQPWAERLGLRVATKPRYHRQFDKAMAQAQKYLDRRGEDWGLGAGAERHRAKWSLFFLGALWLAVVFAAIGLQGPDAPLHRRVLMGVAGLAPLVLAGPALFYLRRRRWGY
jgi:tetratricopeptide (TPR) repeat protein